MRRKENWFSRQYKGTLILLAIFIIGILSATIYLINQANISDRKIFQLNLLALFLGLVFEFSRLSKKWTTVFRTALASYILSFLAFLPGKRASNYIFEDHLEMWPYYFLVVFIIIATAIHYKKATKKMTEGIAMLLTVAINYWIISNNYWQTSSTFIKCLISFNVIVSLFSFFQAFTYNKLTIGIRLLLSLWCSIITLVLAIDNFLKLYKQRDIEHIASLSEKSFVFFEYFLLGVSSIYIAQNLTMLGAYLPGKKYLESVRDMNDIHLGRFSKEQVYIGDSIIVAILALIGFGLNYFFQFFPVNFMIWGMITITPFLLHLIHKILG